MMKRVLFYLMVASIPVVLGGQAYQSYRYARVEAELRALEKAQAEWIESNQRLIAGIAIMGSAERIDEIARTHLRLEPIKPEAVLQVMIDSDGGNDG